ncbi:hypothetical protein Agabi119p4_4549 [Agaricus bisporus var. burnettii]|uniref:Peptidase A1 domain-containing protein n=1 Tax=Agaricus bisporus var. burnettii TaxID=192524 RepID=A0A8H7F3J6_AGABI|nr:hypothetical protein Agabi119p4_4549 [Agaricus bisporus var. burnettii]
MRLSFSLPLAFLALAAARTYPFKRLKHPSHLLPRAQITEDGQVTTSNAGTPFSLSTIQDLIYLVDITVAGHNYTVQLDTGSSDLWIKGQTNPLPGVTTTDSFYNITYVLGWASGHLAYAPVEFIGLKVDKQALLDVDAADNPVLGYGLDGICGLGFDSLSSIDYGVNQTSSDSGRSLLHNLFALNPSEPNFIAFSLHRSTAGGGDDDDVEGSFSIGEYEPDYAAVANTSKISTWPLHFPKRWTVLLDSLIVGDHLVVPHTQISTAPSNKAVVLLDSGASYTYAPKSIVDAIYANITGARFDEKSNQWLVPCDHEVNMALQIGGQVFPLNPLDVTPTTPGNNKTCVGSFIPSQLSAESQFDWLIGDNFLRSVYAVYDFGDFDDKGVAGPPYMRLLSLVNPDDASADFHEIRGGSPQHNITYKGLNETANTPSFFISDDVSESIETISKLVPAMLAVVAFNAIVLVVLIIGGVVCWMKKRRLRSFQRRVTRGREGLSPMPMNPVSSYTPGGQLPSSMPVAYEPVSMALTEDTFVPPSPAFHKLDRNMQPGDRPKSIA